MVEATAMVYKVMEEQHNMDSLVPKEPAILKDKMRHLAMAPLFFHDVNNSCLEAGQQVVISSVGGSCSYVLEGGP
jgi:hypothetical protein